MPGFDFYHDRAHQIFGQYQVTTNPSASDRLDEMINDALPHITGDRQKEVVPFDQLVEAMAKEARITGNNVVTEPIVKIVRWRFCPLPPWRSLARSHQHFSRACG